jgi:hypothetical protein
MAVFAATRRPRMGAQNEQIESVKRHKLDREVDRRPAATAQSLLRKTPAIPRSLPL